MTRETAVWKGEFCLYGPFSLFLAEAVNKGPIDKDGTFINAEKPAETGKVSKLHAASMRA